MSSCQHLIDKYTYFYDKEHHCCIENATPEEFEIIRHGKPEAVSQKSGQHTMVMKAATVGNHALLKHILETSNENNINNVDHMELTALNYALMPNVLDYQKAYSCVKILLKAGANPNIFRRSKFCNFAPLHLATRWHHQHPDPYTYKMIELLLKYDAMNPDPIEPNIVKEIKENLLRKKWEKTRWIILAHKSPNSPLSNIPYELVQKIIDLRISM